MTFFFSTGTRRKTAFAVLLMWLFVLVSGVANACLLEARGTPGRESPMAYSFATKATFGMSAAHAGVIASHDAGSDASRAACLKLCDDRSTLLLKPQSGFDLTDPGLAPLLALVWPVASPVVSAPARANLQQSRFTGLPIRTRFSRLTL